MEIRGRRHRSNGYQRSTWIAAVSLGGIACLFSDETTQDIGPFDSTVTQAHAVLRTLIDPLPDHEKKQARVEQLLTRLNADRFEERLRATEELKEMDARIGVWLSEAATSRDLEVRMRTAEVLHHFRVLRESTQHINKAVDVLIGQKDERLIPILIEMLAHHERRLRLVGEYGIRRATGASFGYSAHADLEQRKDRISRWEAWYDDRRRRTPPDIFAGESETAAALGVAIADDSESAVVLVDLHGKQLWKRNVSAKPYAVILLPNGHYLVGHQNGAAEFDLDHRKVWSAEGADLGDKPRVYDVHRLPNGNTLACLVDAGRVVEISGEGDIVWDITELRSPGAAWRLENGNTLISENHANRLIEVDQLSRVLWEMKGLENPADVVMLRNGNILAAEWNPKRAFEVNRDRKIVWETQGDGNVNSARRLPDGNTVCSDDSSVKLVDSRGETLKVLHTSTRKYGKD